MLWSDETTCKPCGKKLALNTPAVVATSCCRNAFLVRVDEKWMEVKAGKSLTGTEAHFPAQQQPIT